MQLFVKENLTYSKTASAELEEDATQWPRQVLTELFRVLPEISEYTPDVRFIKSNEEQGYAVGVVVVTNTTNSALASQNAGATSQPKALIPIIVKNGRLSPLDTLMASSGRMYPLTVERLREVLYRPESFELVTDDWGDSALWQLFAPPGAGGLGQGAGGGGMGGGGGVQYLMGPGMKSASMIDLIEGTVLEPDLEAFTARYNEDPVLLKVASQNPEVLKVLQKLAAAPVLNEQTAASYEQVLSDIHPVEVALMRYEPTLGLYSVKTAHRGSGRVELAHMDRGEFLRFAGDKIAARVDADGAAVAAAPAEGAVIVAGPGGDKPRVIDRSGFYTCFDSVSGKQVLGWVITNLIDFEGNKVPIALFANSTGAVTQDQIAGGHSSGAREDLPRDPPKGTGCFVTGNGSDYGPSEMQGTVPLTVKGSTSDGQSIRYTCTDLTGVEMTVILQRGMKAVVAFPARKELVLPYGSTFVSLENELPPLISKGIELEEKTAVAMLQSRLVVTAQAFSDDRYRLTPQHMPKLAAALPLDVVERDDALFALCVAGLGADDAYRVLNKVASIGRLEVATSDIGGAKPFDTTKIAEMIAEIRALRPGLQKEAAALPDAMTVDAVLSLDFINSENVRTFISMIPYLEKALNKICELVFASRLGLTEIPETAAARAARGLNDTIRGLKALALRQIEELP